jgi:hypothetical protein
VRRLQTVNAFNERIGVYSKNRKTPTNTLCGQSTELTNIKTSGTYTHYYALKCQFNCKVWMMVYPVHTGVTPSSFAIFMSDWQ